MKPFNKTDAIQILKRYRGADKLFRIDERGVWPTDEKEEDEAEVEDGNWAAPESDQTETEESKFMYWRPASVFAHDPDAPKVSDTPMLPFPFTVGELAAFMVGGVGAAVAGHYGDWVDGPDPDRLNEIPQHENFARLAVKNAYAARREAERIVEGYPTELEAKADRAREAWNKERTAALDAEMETTADDARKAVEKWQSAIVRHLLQPAPVVVATVQTPATPAPVVVVINTPVIPRSQRPNLLTPLIEKAQRGETDPFNAAVIWPKLCEMAESKTRPLIGVTPEGLQWVDGNDDVKFLSKEALGDRLGRLKRAR